MRETIHPLDTADHHIAEQREELVRYINLKLAALGQPVNESTADRYFLELTRPLLRNYLVKDQMLGGHLCPADRRIEAYLNGVLRETCPDGVPRLPANTFVLDRVGVAREMSLPPTGHRFSAAYLESYRVAQGVLHNPRSDRRTTQGIFHVVEGGLPIPADKIAVPRQAFAGLLARAFQPPADVLRLPFTADQSSEARVWVSLLLRPLVCPEVGSEPWKTMEIRFFAPGSLVSNLDFIEGIFGNAGDPYLSENDAALDYRHWTGHTGCVILAPHLVGVKKKDLGLPRVEQATARQRRDKMCWSDPNELYNNGGAFKVTCRDKSGVMVTIIADSYYGYCKKEVKTQISYASNLFGMAQEEHAGGAIAFPSYVLGQDFLADGTVPLKPATFERALQLLGDTVEPKPEGYAVDRRYPNVFYVPEASEFFVRKGYVRWQSNGQEQRLPLRAGDAYVLPSGYRLRMEKQMSGSAWRLVGTRADGTLIHKPSTVSGGGKSEISKSIASVLLKGPVFVRDYQADMEQVAAILAKDYSNIRKRNPGQPRDARPILSVERSLGSVIQLLTPSAKYVDEYNDWLRTIPQIIRQLVFTVKRYYRPEWGDNWREHFTVDRVNGFQGHELRYDKQQLMANYLRVGREPDGSWRIFKLRPDFHPATKVQVEDDITVSAVVPHEALSGLDSREVHPSVKVVANCENLLFQRPDDAIEPGFDEHAEADIASPGTFLSNYEPLTVDKVRAMVDHVVVFDRFTEPMQKLLLNFLSSSLQFAVCSAVPRIVDGKPSKNPRYQQKRPDRMNPRETYLARVGAHLDREVPAGQDVPFPVNSVLAGRRANPAQPEIGLPPLAVYGPIHYQELPELFMDFICSLTGKSPSTTGFGSEGALTKGPFNAMPPVIDVNNAVVDAILTGYEGFTSVAGYVGPNYPVDHDISMLVPEIWCRMKVTERDPKLMLERGYLEKVEDFEYEGRKVLASRLGYRITAQFAEHFLGRVFETPDAVFPEPLLRPETQDMGQFATGIEAMVDAQRRVAMLYFEDGSVEQACPPVKALLHIMAHGHLEGEGIESPRIRGLFEREAVLGSDWYRERLQVKQRNDVALWRRHVDALAAARTTLDPGERERLELDIRLEEAQAELARVRSVEYLGSLVGTLGGDPMCH
jgi:phosphoenolpyruvate carboxykinase (diphosphate)